MRITIQLLPLFLLVLTLPLSLVHPFNVIEVLIILVGLVGLRVVLNMYRMGQREKDNRIILETMSLSHYCEKIRWCLDYLNIPYVEEEDTGILGVFVMGRSVPVLKIPGKAINIGDSPDILRYLYGEHCCEKERADFLQPTPERLQLEEKFDKLGFNYRAFGYYVAFNSGITEEREKRLWGLFQPGVPEWQKVILKFFSPVFRKLVSMKLDISVENGMKLSRGTRNYWRN